MPEKATQRVPGSIGLGLYIVREIVVAHGGEVENRLTAKQARRLPFACREPPPKIARAIALSTARKVAIARPTAQDEAYFEHPLQLSFPCLRLAPIV